MIGHVLFKLERVVFTGLRVETLYVELPREWKEIS